jgi:hypothetical protein
MGNLKYAIKRIKARQKKSDTTSYNSGISSSKDLLYSSSLLIYQSETEIYVGKNRIDGKNGFVDLSEVLDLIIKEYLRADLKDKLTPSACWNVPIKNQLDAAIRGVLVSNGIMRRTL